MERRRDVERLAAGGAAYLVERLGIEQDPAKLDDLGRVLGHVDTMLVARSRNMDNDVSIDMGWRRLLIRHVRNKGRGGGKREGGGLCYCCPELPVARTRME